MLAEDLRHPCISLSVKPPAPPMHRPHYIAPRTLPPGHRATVGFPTEHSVPGTLPPVGCPQYTAPGAMPPAVLQGDLCAPARSGGSRRVPAGAPVDCCRPALAPLQAPPARPGARAAARPGSRDETPTPGRPRGARPRGPARSLDGGRRSAWRDGPPGKRTSPRVRLRCG